MTYNDAFKKWRHDYMADLMAQAEWNIVHAAKLAGCSRPAIYGRLRKCGIAVPDRPRSHGPKKRVRRSRAVVRIPRVEGNAAWMALDD